MAATVAPTRRRGSPLLPSGSTSLSAAVTRCTRQSSPRPVDMSPSRASSSFQAIASRVLLPLVFCRECGQEYYSVSNDGRCRKRPTRLHAESLDGSAGGRGRESRIPSRERRRALAHRSGEIVETVSRTTGSKNTGAQLRVRPSRRKDLPIPIRIGPDAIESEMASTAHFLPAPFRFCLHCGVSYGFRLHSDFGKLATLSSEGRSTATTILSLTTIRELRRETALARACPQASELHRQPAGRQPPGWPLQRLRRDRPASLGPLQGGQGRRLRGYHSRGTAAKGVRRTEPAG